MARSFASASSEYLEIDTAVVTAYPFTVSAWFYAGTNNDYVFWVGDKDVANQFLGAVYLMNDSKVQALVVDGGGSSFAATSTTYNYNVWNHALAIFASTTSRTIYLNGASVGTDATSITPTGADRTALGRSGDSTPFGYLEGRLAHVAVWNAVLNAGEINALASAVSPDMIRPDSRISHWKLLRDDLDSWGVNALTPYNTPTWAPDHPPMTYPAPVQMIVVPGLTVSDTGATSPGTTATDSAVGNIDWVDHANIVASDDSRATIANMTGAGGGSDISYYLKATNFSFGLTSSHTVTGIKVTIERQDTGDVLQPRDYQVRIIKGGAIGATDRAEANYWLGAADEVVVYGGARDKWGETWTYTDINAATFGVALSVYCDGAPSHFVTDLGVDHITVTVYYTVGAVSDIVLFRRRMEAA